MTVPLVALVTTQSTSLSNPGNMKEAPKIMTQKKTKKLTNSHQRLKQI